MLRNGTIVSAYFSLFFVSFAKFDMSDRGVKVVGIEVRVPNIFNGSV